MHCHSVPAVSSDGRVEVLLLGPPNVGKSVIFNRLTGLSVSAANYAGTTVELAGGEGIIADHRIHLIDLPGTYTLSAMNEAEQVATDMLDRTDGMVVAVADAVHLESSVYLLLQVLERGCPTMVVVNRVDIAASKGRSVDTSALSAELGVPVVETIAVTGDGFEQLEYVLAGLLESGEAGGFERNEGEGEGAGLQGATAGKRATTGGPTAPGDRKASGHRSAPGDRKATGGGNATQYGDSLDSGPTAADNERWRRAAEIAELVTRPPDAGGGREVASDAPEVAADGHEVADGDRGGAGAAHGGSAGPGTGHSGTGDGTISPRPGSTVRIGGSAPAGRPPHLRGRSNRSVPIAGKPPRRGVRLARFDSEALVRPWPGLLIAAAVLAGAFGLIVGLGMGVRQIVLLPLAREGLFPFIERGVSSLVPAGVFRGILIGEYGFLIKGIEWPFTLVLPYVLSFYVAMSLLEDSGYLPRLAVLLDGVFSKIGLRGSHSISLLLGYGCAIPGILSARAMGSKKERLIVASLISLAIPCISQIGALFALLAEASLWLVVALFAFSFVVMFVAGVIMDRLIPGERSQLVYELPELLVPHAGILGKKMLVRVRHYLYDGALPMIGAVAVAAVLYETGALARIGEVLAPLVTGLLRLPQEASAPLILGVVRRELTVLPLLEMDLSALQLFTGAVVGLFYVPCIAVVATLAREFGMRVALFLLLLTSGAAFIFGGLFAWGGALLGM